MFHTQKFALSFGAAMAGLVTFMSVQVAQAQILGEVLGLLNPPTPTPAAVPELSGAGFAPALALLVGTFLVLGARRKAR
jgi:hypothetical protein